MLRRNAQARLCSASLCASAMVFATAAYGQNDVAKEVADIKAENAPVRDQLRRMEQQQQELIETVGRLQRQLAAPATPQPPPAANETRAPPAPAASARGLADRYQDGMVIWQTPDDANVPFLLKFNINTQVRYLNTTSTNDTFTDHLGVVREVHSRNDITVNRSMFILGGYVFDKRLRYSSTVWTSAGSASIVVAGTIGWQFNKAITLTGGYTGVPG